MRFDFEKLKAAIHYICEKATPFQDKFDHIKLNKVLWYSDAYAYLQLGSPITGVKYIRKKHGPVPKHQRMALEVLEQEGKIKHGKSMPLFSHRYDVIEDADKTLFQGQELAIIDDVFKRVVLDGHSMRVSERTHGEIWELAEEDEEMPLYTVFAEELGTITEEHKRLATADLMPA
jgi:hypothetical protein